MISPSHHQSVVNRNAQLLKVNTRLHATIAHMEKETEEFKAQVTDKITSVIKLYDKHNGKVLQYLSDNNLVSDIHMKNISELFPVKLDEK